MAGGAAAAWRRGQAAAVEASWRAGPSSWQCVAAGDLYAPALQGSPKICLGAVMLKLAVYYMRTPSKIIQVPSVKTRFGGL